MAKLLSQFNQNNHCYNYAEEAFLNPCAGYGFGYINPLFCVGDSLNGSF